MKTLLEFFRPNRIKGVYQFRDKNHEYHLFVFTSRKVIELDYETGEEKRVVLTSKQIERLK